MGRIHSYIIQLIGEDDRVLALLDLRVAHSKNFSKTCSIEIDFDIL